MLGLPTTIVGHLTHGCVKAPYLPKGEGSGAIHDRYIARN